MALTEGDKALVKELAWDVADTVATRMQREITESIALHQALCPHGQRMNRLIWIIAGACAAGMLFGGGIMALATKLMAGL